MKKVLFLDEVHPELERRLKSAGYTCDLAYSISYENTLDRIEDYYGIVLRGRITMDLKLMERAKNLKFIARSGAGLENIDLESAKRFSIAVLSAPEGNCDAVGEHAIGLLLMLFNKLSIANAQVKSGIWKREDSRGLEIKGKTIGIIGFGHTGSAFAKKLMGFECRILAYDKYKTDYAPDYVEEVGRTRLLKEADIISIHLPLSEETINYVNSEFIDSVEKPFFLINTARGKHVSIDALNKGLESEKVRGACLDVLEFEKKDLTGLSFDALPESFKNLSARDNVVLSPHVAGWTFESYERLSVVLADKILALNR